MKITPSQNKYRNMDKRIYLNFLNAEGKETLTIKDLEYIYWCVLDRQFLL